jgi:LytS/YehU family sensor histidine kinase
MAGMFFTFLSALQLEDERRNTEIQAAQLAKQLELAKLVDFKTKIEPDRLLNTLQEARDSMSAEPHRADQILSELADQLRTALKSFKEKLAPSNPSLNQIKTDKPRTTYWMILATISWLVVGICMAASRLMDDMFVRHSPLNWYGYWYSWLSWAGVALMTPFIFWMSRRFPIDRSHPFSLLAHVSGCMIFWIVINILFRSQPAEFQQRISSLPDLIGIGLAWGFKFDVYGAVVLAALALSNLERKKHEEFRLAEIEKMFVSAQLEALKMQLHPHFLFNALNSIVELIHENPQQAEELLDRLKQFLRITLLIDGVQDVPLRKELDFIDCYLQMQKVRFPKRLSVKMDIDENSMESRVPVLILQPLVENAIRHGIAQNPEPGEISIYSRMNAGSLQLRIRDTGPGISDSTIHEGIGLSNTKARLQHMYGKNYRLEIQNEAAGGLLVSLEIPAQ